MVTITDLPEAILDLIFEYLNNGALRSASLTTLAWKQTYKRHGCREIHLDLLSDAVVRRLTTLERWKELGLLNRVHRISINTGDESDPNSLAVLASLQDEWIPELAGLKSVKWSSSAKSESGGSFKPSSLPPGVLLDVVCQDQVGVQIVSQTLSTFKGCTNLRSLQIDCIEDQGGSGTLSALLKETLLACSNLKKLKINANDTSETTGQATNDSSSTSGPSWTVAEIESLPELQELDWQYDGFTEEMLEMWAAHGKWALLEKLETHDSKILKHLVGRLPALESLSVSSLTWLGEFLREADIRELSIMDAHSIQTATEASLDLQDILSMPQAKSLTKLRLRTTWDDSDQEFRSIEVGTIAKHCPDLRELTIAVGKDQYRNAVGFFCWMDSCIQAVLRMPKLTHLSVVLPRIIYSGSVDLPPEITFLTSAGDLWSQLSAYGRRLREVRIVAFMTPREALISERNADVLRYMSQGVPALTYIARPAEKDWDAERGLHTTSCPELEEAETLLLSGRLSKLSETGEYSKARRVVDDISALAHSGSIVAKKKIRPMPVWLTPEEEQDRREGPPNWRRRTKRAVVGGLGDFFGDFRAPFSETPGRTAAEKARARENGFGGRPGWSKSSMATRVVWRR